MSKLIEESQPSPFIEYGNKLWEERQKRIHDYYSRPKEQKDK